MTRQRRRRCAKLPPAWQVSYTLGVLFDRLADFLFEPWDRRLKTKFMPDAPAPVAMMRFEIGSGNEPLDREFEYNRSRMRIARVSAVNVVLTTLCGVAFVLVRAAGMATSARVGLCLFLLGSGAAAFCLCVFAWQRLMRTYLRMLKAAYDRLAARPIRTIAG